MSQNSERMPSLPDFQLRPATEQDFAFAQSLYVESMEPLLNALGAWDAQKADAAFKSYFIPSEIEIVELDDADVGWLQVSRTAGELCLDQLHLISRVRGQGIGTQLINRVIEAARAQQRDVTLSLIKGNPSLALYKRLGFQLVAEDSTKFHMRRTR